MEMIVYVSSHTFLHVLRILLEACLQYDDYNGYTIGLSFNCSGRRKNIQNNKIMLILM